MFSKTCEYGIKAAIYIAGSSKEGKRVRLKDIASNIDSPEAFTAKILQLLAKNNIIDSIKGPTGGFEINEEKMKSIMLNEIVLAIDGDKIYNGCGLGLHKCNAKKPCPLHDKFQLIRDDLKKMLITTSLYSLSEGLTEGIVWLKR
ncbi:MAG: Rrf2 family transcriptional regulator [Flavobacteriales bacterium]|nr:Rrf2 family transcriptional regulator [Flavobacteriales bacterium]